MKIITIILIYCITTQEGFAQDRAFFNIIPDIGAAKGQCVFSSIACDSQYIYIVGDEVVSQDSNGRDKIVKPHLTKFDYHGHLIHSKVVTEADFSKPYKHENYPLFKRNDSIYYYNMFNWDDTTLTYLKNYIVAINMSTGKIIKKIKVDQPVEVDIIFSTNAEMDPDSKNLIYVFRHQYSMQYTLDNYIYTYNDSLELLSRIKVKVNNNQRLIAIRYVSFKDGFYHLIGDELECKNNNPDASRCIIYLKVDASGNVIRQNWLKTPGNIYTSGGFTYTILHDGLTGYYIGTNDLIQVQSPQIFIPYVFHVSSELDTVYWRTRFQHPLYLKNGNTSFINSMAMLNDSSGMVVCGSVFTQQVSEPDYGILFKSSLHGDSLWTRQLQPLDWDSTRAVWMVVESIRTTPYNTMVVCGRVGDGKDNVIRAWLLHLDSEGCLIPGCGKIVKVEDIRSGKEKAFEIYPNPASSDHIYLQSRISSSQDYHLGIYNLQGKELKITRFRPQEGVQFILDLPLEIPNGEYILQISGTEFNQSEKLIIER